MKGMSTLVSIFLLQFLCCLIGSFVAAHPAIVLNGANHRTNQLQAEYAAPSKRAFDRLEASPFDFSAYAKRYSDDDSFDLYRRKKSFDRLDAGRFDFGLKRKRSFDRLDAGAFDFGFNLRKRSVPGEQRAAAVHPAMSIASLVRNVEMRPEPSFLYFAP